MVPALCVLVVPGRGEPSPLGGDDTYEHQQLVFGVGVMKLRDGLSSE